MQNKIPWIGIVIVLLVLILSASVQYVRTQERGESESPAPVEQVEEGVVVRSGSVTKINLDQAAFDGPYLITLQSDAGEISTIAIPSMGLPLCAAYKNSNIVDVSTVKVGQMAQVRGILGENGSIVPCASADHYFRVEGNTTSVAPMAGSLTSKPWKWVHVLYNDGTEIKPKKSDAFTLTFNPNGTFGASTDCNGVGGKYVTGANSTITFSDMISTLMYCEGSNEQDFTKILSTTSGYHFGPAGELMLDLAFDSGTAVFK